ncbi:hydroxymethylglutaryl-CoA lyase [Halobacillus litoralis]|uniref:Hydroxymethylglutaryl-CoA lyase n=1 Tax=Halobacillus litoralis TaxID=45668 RepID=A0A845FB81_9BACI|nr:hydroxymethylglutaryl-CoA lyase [Halobacillus litoralis]MYL71672.1 hydroxymethylglutaryl-CoA lyase [Halobacillus litoralis]
MIHICEVGPRDGLQNEKKWVPTEKKVELIERLVQSGLKQVEAVSFVNPKVVPQMSDAEQVMEQVPRDSDVQYSGLVLSRSGLERALRTNIDVIHTVLATSDTFNLKNAKRTVEESKDALVEVTKEAQEEGKPVTGVLGTVFGCPFEGDVPINRVLKISEDFIKAGCTEMVLADTTGQANPLQVKKVVHSYQAAFKGEVPLRLHFHNTRGLGLANVLAAYQEGVTSFDSSIGGLGGCPFAPKAVGNVCTEDMVHMFHQMGVETSASLDPLVETTHWLEGLMEKKLPGMVSKL